MFLCAWLRRLLCRRLLTLVLFSYFLMILLFVLNLDFTEPESEDGESFALMFPDSTFFMKRDSQSNLANRSSSHVQRKNNLDNNPHSLNDVWNMENELGTSGSRNIMVKFAEPVPLLQPFLDNEVHPVKSGDFISLGEGAFVYSAFIDDRKEDSFIRILSLVSQHAANEFIYCYFNDTPKSKPTQSERYQLCENHNKLYGGYFYSCQVPGDSVSKLLRTIVISFTEAGPRVKIPFQPVQPSRQKLAYLNLYPQGTSVQDDTNNKNENVKLNVPLKQWNVKNSPEKNKRPPSRPTLSFAICVSPLFGNISVHRLVEFLELSRLLGAEHFIFYNHSMPRQISDVLRYYMNKQIVSVLPWTLPTEVTSVWYYGQLLANNDCLYRTMPYFDLVSFNDMDEFIVPHSNASTWKDAFSSLLTDDRCGFSFQSAFYDPGIRDPTDSTLLTPALTAKSEMYSKVRTKVMLCPWRVFEVGIHHISKQNRENWRPWGIPPSVAYLHHYRRCVANFGMRCGAWEKDLTIANRYFKNLTLNYERELNNILLLQENARD